MEINETLKPVATIQRSPGSSSGPGSASQNAPDPRLLAAHANILSAAGLTARDVAAGGYESVVENRRLRSVGLPDAGRRVPGLLVPLRRPDGSAWGYQYLPDQPRTTKSGRTVAYETPTGQQDGFHVPLGARSRLDQPADPLWIATDGIQADAMAAAGLCCIALVSPHASRGPSGESGPAVLPSIDAASLAGRRVVLVATGCGAGAPWSPTALARFAEWLTAREAIVGYLHLTAPGTLASLLAVEAGAAALYAFVRPDPPMSRPASITPEPPEPAAPVRSAVAPVSLAEACAVFTRRLGASYDLDAMVAAVAVAVTATTDLGGDTPWLLIVSGSGNTKTETVAALAGLGAHVTSTITSEGALLSATSAKERTRDATGGLLRRIGDSGVLVIKDVTSILSMNRDARTSVLAALREVADGSWERNVGTDGGRTLTWTGRCVTIGAVTTAWDSHHAVVSAMGDRFLLLRMDSNDPQVRRDAGRSTLAQTGHEQEMRAELSAALAGLAATASPDRIRVAEDDKDVIVGLADLVTLCRTAVETDFRGDPEWAHSPEAPTRLAKYLLQLVRGATAIGAGHDQALALATRIAGDCIPPTRKAVLLDIMDHPATTIADTRKRLNAPYRTVDRTVQCLQLLGLVQQDFTFGDTPHRYSVTDVVDPATADRLRTAGPAFRPTNSATPGARAACA